ncbi:MAG: hypothetical protein ACFUZC_12055 [Chthoniobacteraceae bacterium]
MINNGASTSALTVTGGGTYSGVIANGSGTTALTVSGSNLVLGGINIASLRLAETLAWMARWTCPI